MNNTETTLAEQQPRHAASGDACASLPDLTRNRYFNGLMLAANDLQTEQDYFREKLKLLNRCLQGYGTVCGLKVVPQPVEPDCDPQPQYEQQEQQAAQQAAPQPLPRTPARVLIECGLALDCEGNEIIVRQPLPIDLWHSLEDAEKKQVEEAINGREGKACIYLSVCYCVQLLDPVRPIVPDACGVASECMHSKLRDSVRVKVSTQPPRDNPCRDNCCDKCKDKCLLLAKIDLVRGRGGVVMQIYNDLRRWIGLYQPTVITGINWTHAGIYEPNDGERILQESGLIVQFSRDISGSPIHQGVMDVMVVEGGKGRRSGFYRLEGDVAVVNKTQLVFKQTSGEDLQDGDQVIITIRTDQILDACCRPVDGNHVGGKVPLLEPSNLRKQAVVAGSGTRSNECQHPPRRYGSWTSGNGSPGGTFESWFFAVRTKGKSYDPVSYGASATPTEQPTAG